MSLYKLVATLFFAFVLIGCTIARVTMDERANATFTDPSCAVIVKAQWLMLEVPGTREFPRGLILPAK